MSTKVLRGFIQEVDQLEAKVKEVGRILSALQSIEKPARRVELIVDCPGEGPKYGSLNYQTFGLSLDAFEVAPLVAAQLRFHEKRLEDRQARLERMLEELPNDPENE